MDSLYWRTEGQGKQHLVLLHGWGLNAEVWNDISSRLASQFTLHLVDLPGYARSHALGAMTLCEMSDLIILQAKTRGLPSKMWYLGWSLGGLVASDIALRYEEHVKGLITVASSPCFAEKTEWKGIRLSVLSNFKKQLSVDFKKTVERFLALQTLGSPRAREDMKALKEVVLSQPLPAVEVLNQGLTLLQIEDYRTKLCQLTLPMLRIYGELDGLVPKSIIPELDNLWPNSHSVLVEKAAHAPFISHPDIFCQLLTDFIHGD